MIKYFLHILLHWKNLQKKSSDIMLKSKTSYAPYSDLKGSRIVVNLNPLGLLLRRCVLQITVPFTALFF